MGERTLKNEFLTLAKLWLFAALMSVVLGTHAAPEKLQRKLLGVSTGATLGQSQDSITVKTIASLRSQVAHDGSVRIIVGVRVPFAPEGGLTASDATLQRREIATANASVLKKHPTFNLQSRKAKTFASIPFMAMEVTAIELEDLLASPG